MGNRIEPTNLLNVRYELEKLETYANKIDPAQRFMLRFFPDLPKAHMKCE